MTNTASGWILWYVGTSIGSWRLFLDLRIPAALWCSESPAYAAQIGLRSGWDTEESPALWLW